MRAQPRCRGAESRSACECMDDGRTQSAGSPVLWEYRFRRSMLRVMPALGLRRACGVGHATGGATCVPSSSWPRQQQDKVTGAHSTPCPPALANQRRKRGHRRTRRSITKQRRTSSGGDGRRPGAGKRAPAADAACGGRSHACGGGERAHIDDALGERQPTLGVSWAAAAGGSELNV